MIRRLRVYIAQAGVFFWTAIVIVPFVLIVLLALRNNQDIYAHPLGVGGTYHPENFTKAWRGPGTGYGMERYFVNTSIAVAVALTVALAAGTTASFFLTRFGRRTRTWCLRVALVGTVVPVIMLIIPFYQAYNVLGLLNRPFALGIAYGALTLPAAVLILHAFFSDFPEELVEAAALDGLGEFGAFLRIVLPLSKGAITAVGMVILIFVWGETQLGIVLLQDGASQTVSVGLLGFRGQFTTELGPLFAGLAIASIPVILIYLAFNRTISKGIALGGVFR